jgi:hypothetical protein
MPQLCKKSVTIHGPYGYTDATYAACVLAQTLRRIGYKVAYVTSDTVVRDIHFMVDRDVVRPVVPAPYSGRSRLLVPHRYETKPENIIWFDVNPRRLQALRELAPMQRHTLVLTPENFAAFPAWPRYYSHVVCTRRDVFNAAEIRLRRESVPIGATHVRWDSEWPLVTDGQVARSAARIMCYFGSMTTAMRGACGALGQLREFLQGTPDVSCTLWHETAWDMTATPILAELVRAFGPRLSLMRNPDALKRAECVRTHSVYVLVDAQQAIGTVAADAIAGHCPVVAYDSAPLNDLVTHDVSGQLVPCRQRMQRNGIVTYRGDHAKLFEVLTAYVRGAQTPRQREWPQLEQRRRAFLEAWEAVLSSDSPQS